MLELSDYESFIVISYFLLFIPGFIGNLFVLIFLVRSSLRSHHFNRELLLILLNLTVADLLTEVFGTAAIVLAYCVEHPSGVVGDVICKILSSYTLLWIFTNVSVITVCYLSWERYKAATIIKSPTHHTKATKKTIIILVLSWIVGAICYTPFIPFQMYKDDHCTESFPNRAASISITLMDTLLFFLFPIVFFSCTYYGIIRKLRESDKRLGSAGTVRRKVTRMSMVIVVTYLICWAPAYLLYLIRVLNDQNADNYDKGIEMAYIPAFAASASHPIVFTIHSKPYRDSVTSTYRSACRLLADIKLLFSCDCSSACKRKTNQVTEVTLVSKSYS